MQKVDLRRLFSISIAVCWVRPLPQTSTLDLPGRSFAYASISGSFANRL
jgi:hypothetical protein